MTDRILLACSLLLLLLSGCTKEDMSSCVTRTAFTCKFELNNEHTDQFAKLVNNVDLYIFDGSGLLVKHISHTQYYLPQGYTIAADLNHGTYTAVMYGTVNGNKEVVVGAKQGSLTTAPAAVKEGESRIEDIRLMLNSVSGKSDKDLGVVLHGMVSQFAVTSKPETHNVAFTRNTNTVELNVSGLEHFVPQTRALPGAEVRIEGNNKAYLHDNTLDMELGKVTHAPFWQRYANSKLTAHLSVLRLFKEHPMVLKIYDGNKVIWQLNLTEEILKSPDYSTNEDLDREDMFKVNITVTTSGDMTIVVNGWTTTTAGEVVG